MGPSPGQLMIDSITSEALNHEIDLSTVDFDFLTKHRGETASGKLTGDVPLGPAKESGTGTAKDAELVALDEVIAQINDLFPGITPTPACATWSPHQRPAGRERDLAAAGAQQLAGSVLGQPGPAQRVRRRSAHHLQEIDGGGINDVGRLWAAIFCRLPSG